LQANGNPRQASWHLQVDDEQEVYQSLPFTEAAYHSGTYKGNYSSIAIEMCVNQDGNYQQTVLNTIQVINFLKAKYPTILRVIQHHHWSRKNCPRILRSATVMSWTDFLAQTNKKTPSTSAKAIPYQSTTHLFPKAVTFISPPARRVTPQVKKSPIATKTKHIQSYNVGVIVCC